ncbi:hypothetical protein [Nocardia vinacea]|uniref:hypothetical protein n=1 Tax=Nocardia vinacea TaxID=96468 RepID=UPI00031A34D7|nr:hypothetical protein [Nocardia vinacea]
MQTHGLIIIGRGRPLRERSEQLWQLKEFESRSETCDLRFPDAQGVTNSFLPLGTCRPAGRRRIAPDKSVEHLGCGIGAKRHVVVDEVGDRQRWSRDVFLGNQKAAPVQSSRHLETDPPDTVRPPVTVAERTIDIRPRNDL